MFRRHDLAVSRRNFLRGLFAGGTGLAGAARFTWAAAAPERLIVAMSVGVDSINPYGHSDSPLSGLWGHVMETLVDTDYERRNFSAELAESWSPKGNQWTFKLRKHVTFHDGDVYAVRKDLIWKPRPDEKIPLVNARFQI
jgi:peptide/nickel transport system substrate-binding protein